jgi:hypothetical protein
MIHAAYLPAKLNDGHVTNKIMNDSLGTVDTDDTADTDPDDEMESDPSSGIEA